MVSFGADAQERDEDGLSCAEYARADGWHALADEMEKIVDARVHQWVPVVAVAWTEWIMYVQDKIIKIQIIQ